VQNTNTLNAQWHQLATSAKAIEKLARALRAEYEKLCNKKAQP